MNWEVNVLCSLPVGHWFRRGLKEQMARMILDAAENDQIRLRFFPTSPSRFAGLNCDSMLLRRAIGRVSGPSILHARNANSTRIAWKAVKHEQECRIVYDVRGAEPEECLQRAGYNVQPSHHEKTVLKPDFQDSKPYQRALQAERIAAMHSDGWTCVSSQMLEHLKKRYPNATAATMIQPCALDVDTFAAEAKSREQVRHMLSLRGKFVIAYVGSLVWYQLPEVGIRWFAKLSAHIPNLHLLAITPSAREYQELALQSGLAASQFTVKAARSLEVPRLLSVADAGLLLRDDTIVNQVASPVKFGEYLASGVPVLISQHLGDYSLLVRKHQVGAIIENLQASEDEVARVAQQLMQLHADPNTRSRCHSIAREQLSWEEIIPRRIAFLQELFRSKPVARN